MTTHAQPAFPMDYTLGGIALSASGIALAAVLFQVIYQGLRDPTSHIPGPWYSRWTGLVLEFQFLRGSRNKYVDDLHQQYGPVVRIGPSEVDVTDINAVKSIYSNKETFRKSQFYERVLPPGQQSLFTTTDVDFHRRRRRLLAGPMSETSLKTFLPQIEARVQLAIDRIGQEMKSRGSADVFKWWLFLATDTIGELTFGDSFKMLEYGRKNDYSRELERVGVVGAIRITFPSILPIGSIIHIPFISTAIKSLENMRRYSRDSLERYQRLVAADPNISKQTLFTKLFQAHEDETVPICELIDEAFGYIVAGSDTTANSLTYLTWAVCRRPDIRAALVEELRTLPRDYTEAHLRELPYLNQVIDETLRLHMVVPSSLSRRVPPGGAQLTGYWFNEGTVIGTQAYSMHRDSLIFPNPDEFIPSRWESPTKAMKDAYMPFGRGPRVCIGMHLAKIEMRLAAARFFVTFPEAKLSTLEGMCDSDMKPRVHFLTSPSGGRCLIQAA